MPIAWHHCGFEVACSAALVDQHIRDIVLSYPSLGSQFPHLKSRDSDDLPSRAVV